MYGSVNTEGKMNLSDKLMAYEAGEMEPDDVVELFQELINSGMAWSLQGSYGRQAQRLIDAGTCTRAVNAA